MRFYVFYKDLSEIFQKLFTACKNINPSLRNCNLKSSDQVILIARANFDRDYLKTQIFDLKNLSSPTFFNEMGWYLAVTFITIKYNFYCSGFLIFDFLAKWQAIMCFFVTATESKDFLSQSCVAQKIFYEKSLQ